MVHLMLMCYNDYILRLQNHYNDVAMCCCCEESNTMNIATLYIYATGSMKCDFLGGDAFENDNSVAVHHMYMQRLHGNVSRAYFCV